MSTSAPPRADRTASSARLFGKFGWLLPLIGFLLAGAAWAWSSPIGSSPDDDWHMASIWCPTPLAASGCLVGETEAGNPLVEVPSEMRAVDCYAGQPNVSAACTQTYIDAGTVVTERVDSGAYPPWYYRTAHLVAGSDVQRSVYLIRMLNVALAALVVVAAALVTPAAARTPVVVAGLVASVPLGIFLAASVSPNSWGNTGVLGAWAATHALLSTDDRRRRILAAALLLFCTVLAAGSRGDTAAYLVLVTAGYVFFRFRRGIAWQTVVLAAIASVLGVFGFLQARQVGVLSTGWNVADAIPASHLLFENLTELPSLFTGSFGLWALGWLDTGMPALTWAAMLLVVGGLAFLGTSRITWWKAGLLVMLLSAAAVLMMIILQQSGARVGQAVQPRYILPLLAVVIAVLLVDETQPLRSIELTMPTRWLIFGLLALANSAALHRNIRRYVTGVDVLGFNLNRAPIEWWVGPGSPLSVWLLGSAGFALAAGAVLFVGRNVSEPGARRAGPQEAL